MAKRILGSIIIIATIFLALAFSFLRHQKPVASDTLVIAIPDSPYFSLLVIANKKGYFQDEGVTITFKKMPSGKQSLSETLSEKADLAAVGENHVVLEAYEGKKVGIISTLYSSTRTSAILGNRDHGVNSIEDLRGKKIGVVKGTSSEFYLFSYLTSQGIGLSEVEVIDIPRAQMKNAFENGEVDAITASNPALYDIKKTFPAKSLVVFQSDLFTNTSVLAGNRDKILQKKKAVVKLLRGLRKAEILVQSSNKEALDTVIAAMPEFSKGTIQETWKDFKPELRLSNVLLNTLDREAEWYKDNNVYSGSPPDFKNIIVADCLNEVNPDAVTIY